ALDDDADGVVSGDYGRVGRDPRDYRSRPRLAGRGAPDALRVVADPEPREAVGGDPSRDSRLAAFNTVSSPLQGSGASGAGTWRLAVDCGNSGLGVGAVRRATELVPVRTSGVR